MNRATAAIALGLLAAAAARADIPVPPPPGKKFVRVDYTITTEKSYPDYDFYVVTGFTPKKVEFGPDTPVKIDGNRGGIGSRGQFVAVPKGTAEKFPNEKAFADAFRTNKVPGLVDAKRPFDARTTVDAKDTRSQIAETYAVEKVDPKAGIVLRGAKAPTSPVPPRGEKNASEEESVDEADSDDTAASATYTPQGGTAVAGVAAALGLAFAGVWLVRRSRP